ncbi:MAG: chromate transporter [Bacteroidales bacterium]|nr:MAG: chromate transporter [Bacteroidales bacterium]
MNNPTLLRLFTTFLKIGAFTFGGGYAMISIIENELVTKKGWIDSNTYHKYLAIAQISPGILAVNISILIGNMFFKKRGAIVCVVAASLPSFITILTIGVLLAQKPDNHTINAIFKGIRPMVVALIMMPVISMIQKTKPKNLLLIIPLVVVVLVAVLNISPIYIILGTIIIGVGVTFFND